MNPTLIQAIIRFCIGVQATNETCIVAAMFRDGLPRWRRCGFAAEGTVASTNFRGFRTARVPQGL